VRLSPNQRAHLHVLKQNLIRPVEHFLFRSLVDSTEAFEHHVDVIVIQELSLENQLLHLERAHESQVVLHDGRNVHAARRHLLENLELHDQLVGHFFALHIAAIRIDQQIHFDLASVLVGLQFGEDGEFEIISTSFESAKVDPLLGASSHASASVSCNVKPFLPSLKSEFIVIHH